MAATFEERQTLATRREAQGDGSTCIAVEGADEILEKLPTYELPGSDLLPAEARTQEVWHRWASADFVTEYNL
jgi:hypothetical protein